MLTNQINLLLPSPQSGLLAGILIGDQASLPKDLVTALKNTSTIHMVVVSGQNLSLVATFLMVFVRILGRRLTLLLAIFSVFGYAWLTGWQIPVIRALIMSELALVSQLVGREAQTAWLLALAAAGMLIFNPSLISSISFQLSFLATVAVVMVSPIFDKKLKFMPDLIRQDLSVSLSAQLLTWPVIASNFGQASIFGFIVNLFVLWTIPLIMITGSFALAVSFLSLGLGQLVAFIPGLLLTYYIDTVMLANQLPGITIKVGEISLLVIVGYYLVVWGVVLGLRKN